MSHPTVLRLYAEAHPADAPALLAAPRERWGESNDLQLMASRMLNTAEAHRQAVADYSRRVEEYRSHRKPARQAVEEAARAAADELRAARRLDEMAARAEATAAGERYYPPLYIDPTEEEVERQLEAAVAAEVRRRAGLEPVAPTPPPGLPSATVAPWLLAIVKAVAAEDPGHIDHDELGRLREEAEEATALLRDYWAGGTHHAYLCIRPSCQAAIAYKRDPRTQAVSRERHYPGTLSDKDFRWGFCSSPCATAFKREHREATERAAVWIATSDFVEALAADAERWHRWADAESRATSEALATITQSRPASTKRAVVPRHRSTVTALEATS